MILSNYNGLSWPTETKKSFVKYIQNGGNLVVIHAADNSFPDWKEFNEMIGLGGWAGRNEKGWTLCVLGGWQICARFFAGSEVLMVNHGHMKWSLEIKITLFRAVYQNAFYKLKKNCMIA